MTARKRSIKSDLTKVDAHRITKAEYDAKHRPIAPLTSIGEKIQTLYDRRAMRRR